MSWEALKTTGSRPWVASWVDPLLKLESLEYVEVIWIFDRPRLRRMADTVSLMRQHMLAEDPSGLKIQKGLMADSTFEFRMLHRLATNGELFANHIPSAKDLLWSSYCLSSDGSQPIERNRNILGSQEMTLWRQHIQDLIEVSSCLYICVCELRRA
jgi:hypothetical protein